MPIDLFGNSSKKERRTNFDKLNYEYILNNDMLKTTMSIVLRDYVK